MFKFIEEVLTLQPNRTESRCRTALMVSSLADTLSKTRVKLDPLGLRSNWLGMKSRKPLQ